MGTGSVAQVGLAAGETLPPRCLSPFSWSGVARRGKGDRHRRRKPLSWGSRYRGDGASPRFRDYQPCAVVLMCDLLSQDAFVGKSSLRSLMRGWRDVAWSLAASQCVPVEQDIAKPQAAGLFSSRETAHRGVLVATNVEGLLQARDAKYVTDRRPQPA